MRTLAIILWHIPFLGFLNAILTFLIGGLLILTVVGSPLGLGLVQLSKFLFTPFTSEMIKSTELKQKKNRDWQTYKTIVRVLYFPFGLILAVITVFQIAGLFISIVGIPVALVLAKSLGTFFNPVNKVCVSRAVAKEAAARKAKREIDKAFSA